MQCKMLALITCAILCAFLHSAAGRAVEFAYLGCFVDGSPRDLNGLYGVSRIGPFGVGSSTASNSTAMSREYCADVCSLGGFAYFGVQAGVQCFCGNSYGSHGAVAESNCGSTCSGNAAQKCGGSWRNSVFALTYLS
ncbi:hypothetical protein BOX15_Mlig025595g1 [Macrostomum lignano]|uniref:WSC domain-containing protein n=1 Tax=Macrostomum lignano TaxID=282301 RepID=A0A267EKS8_9PLAT|nr:hypothetical protein BOX15_Mlig025595g1 [Macrostomum lignano]